MPPTVVAPSGLMRLSRPPDQYESSLMGMVSVTGPPGREADMAPPMEAPRRPLPMTYESLNSFAGAVSQMRVDLGGLHPACGSQRPEAMGQIRARAARPCRPRPPELRISAV